MPRLIWAPSARRDIEAIRDWLSARDLQAALRAIRAIRATGARLADYPQIGRALDEPFRALTVRGTPYILVYRLAASEVQVIRIRHGRENWLVQPEGDL